MIQQLLDDALDTYRQSPALANLHKLILSFDRITKTFEAVVPNLAILTAVCKHIKPTITTDEIYGLIEKYEYLENTETE